MNLTQSSIYIGKFKTKRAEYVRLVPTQQRDKEYSTLSSSYAKTLLRIVYLVFPAAEAVL